jgi:hypothetical protein
MGSNGVRSVASANGDDDDGDDADRELEVVRSVDRRLSPTTRRDPLLVSLQRHEDAGLVSEVLPIREHRGGAMVVRSQVSVGIDQRICLAWDVPHRCFAGGYRLLGFRRTDGFAAEAARHDLAAHGAKIIDARTNDAKEELLAEGEYFYTFLLYRTTFLGCFEQTGDLVQFSERIPSAKYAIGRLEDTLKARELERKLLRLADKQRKTGTPEPEAQDFARLLAAQPE